ncbi:MAG: phosphatidylserine decarboxylase [Thermodesulfobacteriota bacterium]|nr:phosphatidylserine decarboxylase [Thermodesulfobacteriota bacterium]
MTDHSITHTMSHQYVERVSGRVRTEKFLGDRLINLIYSDVREKTPVLYQALISSRISEILAFINYDLPLGARLTGTQNLLHKLGVDLNECVEPASRLNTARKIFERQIKYWQFRPMHQDDAIVVSPADAKMLAGSLSRDTPLFIKEKFFSFEDLLGVDRTAWLKTFEDGDFAVFRLTPEKYHYNHVPATGTVADIYEIPGYYHSCNPSAVISEATPYSKNKRVVTVIDTDVEGGSRIGLVAMIEIVALMIGGISQCYSEYRYDDPVPVKPHMRLVKGQPKSLYLPGSSVDVLLFQKNRITFDADIVFNLHRREVQSRFLRGFQKPLVETEVSVRSSVARRKN